MYICTYSLVCITCGENVVQINSMTTALSHIYLFEYVQKLRKLTHVGQVHHANNVASAHEDFYPRISLICQIKAKYRVVGIK